MHLLDVNGLSSLQILEIFNLSKRLKEHKVERLLQGKTFILFFPENSLRTRITFEKGIKDLGGECILFPPEALDRREQLIDTVKYIENWADGIVVRHSDFTKITEMARYSSIPIVNAMTSVNHPCEILADLYSISEKENNYRQLVYTFVGPASNISKSWTNVAKIMNLDFNHVSLVGNEITEQSHNYKFHTELEEVLKHSDVILTDSLPNQFRTDDYFSKYQITLDRMLLTKKNSILNPCPPFFRNEEVSEDVINSDYFVGHSFKKNLVYVQQAIILYCLSN
ncbi:ornithine carbamoyltransferase [Paenibacillus turicensis]|uniref:Ornithine carbamoyltransferase n=1 Tax=Paenibacillus turicensis TaxID=160487 RepID=A0ABS4FRK4_9BACL|nr:ornithine carbamoyltransferase [Paenibacillus turicensis]MBP1905195.1 ornithine carbamoyltransferase [Paenibacillus turicensis]